VGVRILAVLVTVASCSAQSLPEGPGKELVDVICSSCHTTERLLTKQWTKPEWQAKVLEMLQEEPDVTQPERDKIVDYLARAFPKHVNVNAAGSNELETVLEISTKEADAIVSYRQQKGAFKNVDDVKKVPGVEAGRIEAAKNRLEF
jgi:competence protein ComEA